MPETDNEAIVTAAADNNVPSDEVAAQVDDVTPAAEDAIRNDERQRANADSEDLDQWVRLTTLEDELRQVKASLATLQPLAEVPPPSTEALTDDADDLEKTTELEVSEAPIQSAEPERKTVKTRGNVW